MENYSMRNATSVEEVRSFFINRAISRDVRPAIDDSEVFYTTDPSGFFLGEVDGEIISSISAVKYGETRAFLGYYVVAESFRGKGYGLAIFKHALSTLSPTHNCGVQPLIPKVPLFETSGFKCAWISHRMLFDVSNCVSYLDKFNPPTGIVVQPAKQVNQDLLSEYDTAVFGAPHHLFLKALLKAQNSINFAATNPRGDIVGFVSARKAVVEEEGWKISPLFADDERVARALLKQVYKKLAMEVSMRKVTTMDIIIDVNPEAKTLASELNGTFMCESILMFNNGVPDIPKEKVFSVASVEIG